MGSATIFHARNSRNRPVKHLGERLARIPRMPQALSDPVQNREQYWAKSCINTFTRPRSLSYSDGNQRFQVELFDGFLVHDPRPDSRALRRTELDSFDIAQIHNLPGLPQVMAVLHGEPAFGRAAKRFG